MTTLSVPIPSNLEVFIDEMVRGGCPFEDPLLVSHLQQGFLGVGLLPRSGMGAKEPPHAKRTCSVEELRTGKKEHNECI